MNPSTSKTSKEKSARKRWNPYERTAGGETVGVSAEPGDADIGMQRVANHRTPAQWGKHGGVDSSQAGSSRLPSHNVLTSRQMFGDNLAISGGQFTQAETVIQNVKDNRTDPFELLQRRVSASAFHNSALRFDPPRCHPNTRVIIQQKIYDWIVQSERRDELLLWLNGAAGAGKSAIMQSIAERCAQAAIAVASFFFFRSDPTRNTMAPLVATLVYQLLQTIPETEDDILQTIEHNPLIFDQSLESQFQQLLILPLLRLPIHLQQLFVVLIDGLDECNDRAQQSNLVKLFSAISRKRNGRIIFLVASRREPQIEAAFGHKHVRPCLSTIPLDNSDIEKTSDDIRHFLNDRFQDIKETHLRRNFLPISWPPQSAVNEIVRKSSGQFIYASVIVNFISSDRAHPAHQLEIIRGLRWREASSQNPFAHLDALYQHIFSQVERLDKVLDILAFVLITKGMLISKSIERVFVLEAGELEVYLADLTAVIECKRSDSTACSEMKFLHASLPDFLLDQSRSDCYHIDMDKYRLKLLCMLLEQAPPTGLISSARESWRLGAIRDLLIGIRAPARLCEAFLKFDFWNITDGFQDCYTGSLYLLRSLKKLDLGDQGQAYYRILDKIAVKLANIENWPLINNHLGRMIVEFSDLQDRITQIRQG